jgi:hypothetical protein
VSFLSFYGFEVPVSPDGLAHTDDTIKADMRAVDGTLLRSRLVELRGLEFSTPITEAELGAALRDFLKSRGERWGFDLSGTTADVYGAKGTPPLTSVYGSRGSEVLDDGTTQVAIPKFGSGCVELAPATTNLYTSNVATGTDTNGDTTGFTALNSASLSSSAAAAWQGTKSLLVDSAASAGSGMQASKAACVASTVHTVSVYLRAASGSPVVDVSLADVTNGSSSTPKVITLSTAHWTRVECTHSSGIGTPTMALKVYTHSGAAVHFYADGLQIEAQSYATTWVNGSRAAGDLSFRLGEHQTGDDLTAMCWVLRGTNGEPGTLLSIGSSSNYVRIGTDGADLIATATTGGSDVAEIDVSLSTVADGTWHHVAVVMRRNPVSGSYGLELYVDGVQVGHDAPSGTLPTLSAPTLYVGSLAATSPWIGFVDELVVVPFGMTAAMIAAFATRALTAWPDFLVGGDALFGDDTNTERQMSAELSSDKGMQAARASGWSRRERLLGFKLTQATAI